MERIENRTFDEIKLGNTPVLSGRSLTKPSKYLQDEGYRFSYRTSKPAIAGKAARIPRGGPDGRDRARRASTPIILTSRSDGTLARLGSCAIALLLARHKTGTTS
jgi:hypothetical protein